MKSILPTRRDILAASAATALSGRAALAQSPAAKPNVVYIMADDMGYADLSCYGRREYKTANIDSLAAGGVRFLQAYANSAVCSATRTALITGRYQYRLPVGLEEPLRNPSSYGLPPDHPTLPSLLKKAGYGTTLIGKWHLGNLPNFGPLKSGYDHFWGFRGGGLDYFTHKSGIAITNTDDLWDDDAKIHEAGYLTDLLGDRAVKVIGDYAVARQPFLLSLHFNAPHWPWEGPGDEAESQRIKALVDRDGGSMETYARMVTRLDFQVGRVLKALEANRIAGNTIVIFTSDNGGERFADTWPFTGKKTELLEGGLRIPAIVRWPGHVRAGTTTTQVAISMDWMPTVLAAAGATPDPAYPPDGMNLLPQLTQGAATVSRALYWRYHFNQQRALRDGDLKYLRIEGSEFLFNVVVDPLERANLKDRQPDAFRRMVAAYEDKWVEFRYFFVRKVMLVKYSYGFVAVPGGFGTMDELFEVATLIQTGKIKNFPVVLLGVDYWSPLLDFLRGSLLKNGAIGQGDLDSLLLTDSPAEAISFIRKSAMDNFGLRYVRRRPRKILFERGI